MVPQIFDSIMTGWWYTYPSEQWKSVGIIIPNWMEKKNVPNHQPDEIVFIFFFKKTCHSNCNFPEISMTQIIMGLISRVVIKNIPVLLDIRPSPVGSG